VVEEEPELIEEVVADNTKNVGIMKKEDTTLSMRFFLYILLKNA